MTEILAYQKFPLAVVLGLIVAVPAFLVYLMTCCGSSGAFGWLWDARALAWLVVFPILAVVLALPIFSVRCTKISLCSRLRQPLTFGSPSVHRRS